MREARGIFWEIDRARHARDIFVILTNGDGSRKGDAVMGRGLARDASRRLLFVARQFGESLTRRGNDRLRYFPAYQILTFPVKRHWRQPARLYLTA